MGEELVRAMESETYPFRTICLDFNHNTNPGSPEYEKSQEPRSVAAYGEVEVKPGVGVFLNITRWTPDGLANALNYEDVSASPILGEDGSVRAIPSVALCRCGAVPGATFSDSPLSADGEEPAEHPTTEETEMEYKKQLLAVLGLSEDADDEAIGKAVEAALATKKPEEPKKDEPQSAPEPPAEETAAPAQPLSAELKAELTKQSAALEALSAEVLAMRKQAILDGARLEGKVLALSAEAAGKLSLAELTDLVAKTAPTVPLSARTPAVVPELPSGVDALRAQERAIALACGVKPELMK